MLASRSDLVRRAGVIFRDHGYTLREGFNGEVMVSSIPLPFSFGNYSRHFASVTAAFDRLCPIIGDDEFTSRMVALLRA